jgi:dipeptidase E
MAMFLAGGGSPEQEAQVWGAAFDGVTKVLYWPFALADDRLTAAEAWFAGALESLGIRAAVSAWKSLEGHRGRELADFDLVFVGGGTTSKLAAHVRRHGFDTALADHILGGGRYCGGSAGALLVCEWITVAAMVDNDPDAEGVRGIGAFRGASVFPHADKYSPDTVVELAARLKHEVFALPEASGLRVSNGTVEPIGPGVVRVARPDSSVNVLG